MTDRAARALCTALVAALLTPAAAAAASRLPTKDVPLGTYQLHVSLSYQAALEDSAATDNTANASDPTSAWWNFSTQSETAEVAASWTDTLKLTKTAVQSPDTQVLPVDFIHASAYLHDIEVHPLGSAGIQASESDNYAGTYETYIDQDCNALEPCPPPSYQATPFTCAEAAANATLDRNLVVQWVENANVHRLQSGGYINPLRPGAVQLGETFWLSSSGKGTDGGSVTPNCMAPDSSPVFIFSGWSPDQGLLSPQTPSAMKPNARTVLLPLAQLIRTGRASSSFTSTPTSPDACCTGGTTTVTLAMTSRRVG